MLQSYSSPHSKTCTNAKGEKPQIKGVATQSECPQELQKTLLLRYYYLLRAAQAQQLLHPQDR